MDLLKIFKTTKTAKRNFMKFALTEGFIQTVKVINEDVVERIEDQGYKVKFEKENFSLGIITV